MAINNTAMAMKCPPGAFCFGTGTFVATIALITAIIVGFVFVSRYSDDNRYDSRNNGRNDATLNSEIQMQQNFTPDLIASVPNPVYVTMVPPQIPLPPPAPEREPARPAIPMAIATAGGPSQYIQVGVMRKEDDNPEHDDVLLPLFGRKLQPNRERWNYYTTSGGAGTLPVRAENRDCMDQYVGCSELYDGDAVTVDGLKNSGTFKVMTYTVSAPRYDGRVF